MHQREDIHLGTHSCPLCGNEAPKGHRYCSECDEAGSYAGGEQTGGGERRSAPVRRGSSLPLVLLFFVVSAFGTVLAGFLAPTALSSLPLLGDVAAPTTVSWGEVLVARTTANIRAQATTSSEVVGQLAPGDSVRVEPVQAGWYRIYEAPLMPRLEAKPLGFVYGNLLVSADGG